MRRSHLRLPRECKCVLIVLAVSLDGCALKLGKQPRQEVAPLYSARAPEFRQSAGSLLGPNFVPGNNITTLVNGDEIFPAMLRAIRSAKRSINLETYVFWDGQIGREFTEALAERAQAGVHVNAILDAQGTRKMGSQNLARLRDAGVQVVKYHTAFWPDPRRYNNRSHRKLLIVDGRIGFIGGAGIADLWSGNADSPRHWRDNHYKVTGPVVAQLQATFMANWLKTRGTVLHGPDYFPPLESTGPYLAQGIRSGAHNENLDLMYLLAIASAQHNLRIENAYFLPDDLMRKELVAAAERGVKVEIVVPGKHIDQKLVRAASKRHWPELIKAGVKIFEYEPTMLHAKLMIVDDVFVSVGSGNFDNRSIRLNDEANLDVLDRQFAAEQTRLFEMDRRRSGEVTVDELGGLHFANPLEQAAGLFAPQL
ncbi:MAG TPA: phospholipase D-like domain-containing protein [Candidatus Udaeobacter sp.]|nr:phospholipase D-like domain-containing protein [Candidatus Udaeobacter sp.]